MRTLAVVVIGLVFGVGAAVEGQSLADAAKKAEEARAKHTEPAKVYTNEDLKPVNPRQPPSSTIAPVATAGITASPMTEQPGRPLKDAIYWRDRRQALQTQLDADLTLVATLSTQLKTQRADLSQAVGDHRFVVDLAVQQTATERNRAIAAVANDRREIRVLEDEARRAGVPPGWLRP